MKHWIQALTLTLCCGFFHLAHALTLKSKFTHAEIGDFLVCEGRGSLSLLFVREGDPRSVILEEISFPHKTKPKQGGREGWQKWLNEGAPGHTSWVALEIDLTDTGVMECFSYSRDAWLSLSNDDSFLVRLLDEQLLKVPDHERNKIGPPPEKGPDHRKMWNPPLVYEGQKQAQRGFDLYRIDWPTDDSPISGKQVEIYFNQKDKLFPFPYLMRVRQAHSFGLTFRAIDSGKGLTSPKKSMPRRPFYLTKTDFTDKDYLIFQLATPRYYKKFHLHLQDAAKKESSPLSLPYECLREGEKATLRVEKKYLNGHIERHRPYTFTLSTDHPAPVSISSREVFIP